MPDLDLSREACERRLSAALLEITNHPERWDQGVWALIQDTTLDALLDTLSRHEWPCGTFACLAGTVVIDAGFAQPAEADARLQGEYYLVVTEAGQQQLRDHPSFQRNWNNLAIDFGGLAALLCGLTLDQSGWLFDSDNTLRQLWTLAERYTEGRVTLPAELVANVTNIDNSRDGAGMADASA